MCDRLTLRNKQSVFNYITMTCNNWDPLRHNVVIRCLTTHNIQKLDTSIRRVKGRYSIYRGYIINALTKNYADKSKKLFLVWGQLHVACPRADYCVIDGSPITLCLLYQSHQEIDKIAGREMKSSKEIRTYQSKATWDCTIPPTCRRTPA